MLCTDSSLLVLTNDEKKAYYLRFVSFLDNYFLLLLANDNKRSHCSYRYHSFMEWQRGIFSFVEMWVDDHNHCTGGLIIHKGKKG